MSSYLLEFCFPFSRIAINYDVLKLDFARNSEDGRPHGVKKLATAAQRDACGVACEAK